MRITWFQFWFAMFFLLNRLRHNIANCLFTNWSLRKCSTQAQKRQRIVYSGIQPTGSIHLGNYFGAIANWLKLQADPMADCIFSVVDLHSITAKQDPVQLAENTHLIVACLLACGISPEQCILYKQSDVSEHTELSWIFSCMSTIAQLQRFPQFKEKSETLKEEPLGLLAYPILQCADILLFKANEVPVGEDQLPHIHLCQSMSNRFNGRYGKIFPFPQPKLSDESLAIRIRSLRAPEKKMGKSEADPRGRIEITDLPDEIAEKCKKALTDSISKVTFDPDTRPGVSNLILIHSLLVGVKPEEIVRQSEGLTTANYKSVVAQVIIEKLKPLREETFRLMDDRAYLESVLKTGKDAAKVRAEQTMRQVKEAIGMTWTPKRAQTDNNLVTNKIQN